MIRVYRLCISGVDGIHSWVTTADTVNSFERFYRQYGHEGDSVTFEVWEGETTENLKQIVELYNEEALAEFMRGIENANQS